MSLSHTNKFIDFAILLNGDIRVTNRLLCAIESCKVIAADGGICHASQLKVVPELWIGDFDSVDRTLLQQWSSIKRIFYPNDKDMADGEIAVHKALQSGARNIILVGSISGQRFDYALQHITLATSLKKRTSTLPLLLALKRCLFWSQENTLLIFPKIASFLLFALRISKI
nr:hypothetical protein LOCUS_690 [Candidatus Liberibacter asiaticus]